MPAIDPQNDAITKVSHWIIHTLWPSMRMRRGWSRVPHSAAPNGERVKPPDAEQGDREHDQGEIVEARRGVDVDAERGRTRAAA